MVDWKTNNQTYLIDPGFNPVYHRTSRESNNQESVRSCRPPSQLPGEASSRNDSRNIQQDEDSDEIESLTGTGKDDQHVEDMLSEEEPQLEEF